MKKILFLFAIIFATLTSCSTDDNMDSNTEKTNVSIITMAANDASTSTSTGKNIARGNIYAWVNSITLTAKNNASSNVVSDVFNLTGNYNPNSITSFGLDNVEVGATTFNATSTTDSDKRLTLAPTSGTPTSVLNTLKAKNPYVIYNSGNVQGILSSTGTNIVTIPMTTQQGRILSVFQLDSNTDFRNKFKATINASAEGESLVASQDVPLQGSGLVSFEWSSDKSLSGKKVTFTIIVTPINANMYPNDVATTYTIVETITASTSYSCLYTIDKSKAPKTDVNLDKITFTWQQWIETGCPTGDCK